MINKEKEWQPIPINSLFNNFVNGKAKGRNHLTEVDEGGIAYIGATNRNDGVMCFVAEDSTTGKLIQEGNCIGFIRNGDGAAGYAIYRGSDFISTSDVIYGYGDWINKRTGLFFVVSQDKIKPKYSHGHKRSPERLARDFVMLPVEESGNPDFQYMDDYISDLKDGLLERYKAHLIEQLAALGDLVTIIPIQEKEWRTFYISELFSVSRPKPRNKNDYCPGDIPFVASGSVNNGVLKLCSSIGDERLDERNCITVSPVDGSVFYQPMDFLGRGGAGSSILILRSKKLNKFNGQFIARAVRQTTSKYTYGHMGNKDSIKRERVMLPVNSENAPDYEYMEQYVKNIMIQKYNQYLDFINRSQKCRQW